MATVSVIITDGGNAVVGANVYVGEVTGVALVTDGGGTIAKTVPADFAIVANVIVEVGGIMRGSFGPLLIRAGDTMGLDIDGSATL